MLVPQGVWIVWTLTQGRLCITPLPTGSSVATFEARFATAMEISGLFLPMGYRNLSQPRIIECRYRAPGSPDFARPASRFRYPSLAKLNSVQCDFHLTRTRCRLILLPQTIACKRR